jgi:hypothetical protein
MSNSSYYGERGVSLLPARPEIEDADRKGAAVRGAAKAAPLVKAALKTGNPYAIGGALLAGGAMAVIGDIREKKRKQKIDAYNARKYGQESAAAMENVESKQNQRAALNGEEDYFQNFYMQAKKGGKISKIELGELPELTVLMARIEKNRKNKKNKGEKKKLKLYRDGGAVNVIPKGVTHEEENELGDKGIPIIVREGKRKIAEIELNEIVFHKHASKRIEELVDMYRENPNDPKVLKSLGEFVKTEILDNTIDLQGELL